MLCIEVETPTNSISLLIIISRCFFFIIKMKLSKYIYITKADCCTAESEKYFIFSTRSGLSLLVDIKILARLQNGDFSELDEIQKNKLEKYKILVPKDENEFETICRENLESKTSNDILSFTIQPTANCQFGCYYCGQTHFPHMMTKEVEDFCLHRIKNAISNNGRYKRLSVTWYGGEPLLGFKVIKSLSTRIQDFCHDLGLKYRADMVTNGYLLQKKTFLDLLIKHKIKNFQITLDGVARTHDKRRVLKANSGNTFDVIYRNIKEIVHLPEYTDYNAHINVRINIDKTNYHEVDELLKKFLADGIADKIHITFAPIEDWGGNDAGKASFSHEEFSKLYVLWLKFCIEHNIKAVNLLPRRNYGTCMVETEFGEVIDAYGHTYPCWEFPYSAYKGEEHMISSLKTPNATKKETITLLDFPTKVQNGEYECSTCVFYPLCGGGCPLALHEGRNACPTYRFDIAQRLSLDYEIRRNKNAI